MTNPNLTSLPTIQDPAAVWQPKAPSQSMQDNTASHHGDSYAGARFVDGNLVSGHFSKTSQGSHDATVREANAAAGTPYERALHHQNRSPVTPDQVTDDTILVFPGRGEVTASQARALGWLPGAVSRPFAEAQTQQAAQNELQVQQEQPQEEENPDLRVDLLPDLAVDQAYSALIDSTGGAEQLTAIGEVIESGEVSARTLGTLASQLRCEPQQLQTQIAPIMAAFEQQARAVMSEGGLNSNDIVAYGQQHQPDMLCRAMHRQATLRNTSGYADLRQSYIENLPKHNPSAALNADLGPGISQRQDHKGRVIVRFPDGSEVEWHNAIRAFARR